MKKAPKFNNRNVTNDITMNDFLVKHHNDTSTICLPASMKVHKGQVVHLENPYRNKKDSFKIIKKTKLLHGIVEYKAIEL